MNLNSGFKCGALLGLMLTSSTVLSFEIKPGQWQMKSQGTPNVQIQAEMEQAMAQMKNMPPQQRQQMEQILAQMGMVTGTSLRKKTGCRSAFARQPYNC